MSGEPWQLVESFLKDFLRDVGGTLWGRCRGNLRRCRGNLGGTLGSTFLKDFLRDVGGTLRGRCRGNLRRCRGNLRGCRGNLGGSLGSTFLKDFYRGGRGTLQELITETGWGTPPRGGSEPGSAEARFEIQGKGTDTSEVVRTPKASLIGE